MPPRRHPTRSAITPARTLAAISATLLASAIAIAIVQPAGAATATSWGPQGLTASDSATTITWSNAGNSAADTVPRDARQTLPHTGGKTYSDIGSAIDDGAKTAYSNLKVTVSQTQDLVHQVVDLGITGVAQNQNSSYFLEAFQCWGTADETAPDPTHCQTGVGGVDSVGDVKETTRNVTPIDMRLTAGGDLKASTDLQLDGAAVGTEAHLTATLVAHVGSATVPPVATGARGTVDFERSDGTPIQTGVPLTDGVATLTVPGVDPGTTTSFIARYNATPDENYTSATSSQVDLPRTLSGPKTVSTAPAGSTLTYSLAAGTFPVSTPLVAEYDAQGYAPVGTSDELGGFAGQVTIPTDAVVGTPHTFRVATDGLTSVQTFSFTIQSPPTPPATGSGTNVPNKTNSVPFQAVDGTTVSSNDRTYFGHTTTNTLVNIRVGATADAVVHQGFEMQTGAEASGLGCGHREDAASTSTCWLVIVPRAFPGELDSAGGVSALSPSIWAQRMQVRLQFSDVAPSCPDGQARTLSAGGEVLTAAMASWIPSVCAQDGVSLGYSSVTEHQARQQLASGSQGLVFTSQGSSGANLYAPVALAGTVIGLHMFAAGTNPPPLTDVKLNARLVAKLLTQSYQLGTTGSGEALASAPWLSDEIRSLSHDPEFIALNPVAAGEDPGDLVLPVAQSDADAALWTWLLSDPDARAFLDGCPDGASGGSVINPFYSTRTYAECADQKLALDADAAAKLAATTTPPTYSYQPQTYPPSDGTFPQPGYFQVQKPNQLPLTVTDYHPRESSLDAVAVDLYKGIEPRNTVWCVPSTCSSPVPPGAPGKYTSSATPNTRNFVNGLTTSVSAARYQTVTASLCDDAGTHCVGATTDSLQKAAASFVDTKGAPLTSPTVPHPADGAYPLALPIYGEINTSVISAKDAGAIAKALTTITTTGQVAGTKSGDLPQGYAPATKAMVAQTQTTIAALQTLASGNALPTQTTGSSQLSTPIVPRTVTVPIDRGAPTASPSATPIALPTIATAATSFGFPQFGIVFGLAGGVVTGVLAPIVGRRRKAGI